MNKIMLIWLLLFLSCNSLNALIVGSNTAVSRQSSIVFPSIDSDNEMRGFAAFEDGFALQNALTTCIFNSVFPVSGDVSLNDGILSLSLDLSITKTACILSSGNIYGNGYYLEFPAGQSVLNVPLNVDAVLSLIDQKSTTTTGSDVYAVAWSCDDKYIAAGTSYAVGADELTVYYFDGSSLTLTIQANPDRTIYDLDWHPFSYYIAVARERFAVGNELLIYYLNVAAGTLTLTDSKSYGYHATAVSWHPSGNYLAAGRSLLADEILIYSFSTVTGLLTLVTVYDLIPSRGVEVSSMDWDPGGNYLAVGVTAIATAPELLVFYFDGSTLTLTASNDVGESVRALDWLPTGTYLTIGLRGGPDRVRTYEHRIADGTLTEKVSARIGISEKVRSVNWRPGDEFLAVGNDYSLINQEFKIYFFNKDAFTFSLEKGVEVGGNVMSVPWAHSGVYIATGDFTDYVSVYSFFGPGIPFFFEDLVLVLNSDVNFNSVATFHADCMIEGRGHIIDFNELNIDYGSQLLLQNITLNNVSAHKLCCLDNCGTVSLRNVRLILDDDFSFAEGHFDVLGDVWITGTHIFVYQSDQASNISSNATLHFDSGMTFSYASTSSRNLLAMEDETAMLHLNEATLYSVAPGLQLTKGTLVIEGECAIESDAAVHDDGIMVGDGSSASNNVTLKILPESGPNASTGWFNYKNVG